MVLLEYIDKLISNIDKNNIPKTIDLILDGGAFNGSYQIGGLLYLKRMENKKMISIKRVSGTSIGAFMGLLYILDKMEFSSDIADEIIKKFKKNKNLNGFIELANKFLLEMMREDDYKLANNRLYITYFDKNTKKQVIKNKYKSNQDLIEQLIKSSYLPFLIDGKNCHKTSVDGVNPYFFKMKKRKILFMRLMSFKQSKTALCVKYQINNYGRILEGILDINNFFTTNKRTTICSYVDEWNIIDFSIIRLREIMWVVILSLIDTFMYINKNIPVSISESSGFIKVKLAFINFYNDIFTHYLT